MGGSWDQIWSTEVPIRTLYGQNGPFLPLFDRFLKLGGSIWTITVLDEQSIPLRCSGHPTSLYFKQKNVPHKGGQGKKGPFGPQKTLLGAPEVLGGQRVARRGQYQVKVCGEHESNPGGPIRGSWDQIWSPGALRGPQKGHVGPKWALLGSLWTQKGSDTRSKCVVTMSPTKRS